MTALHPISVIKLFKRILCRVFQAVRAMYYQYFAVLVEGKMKMVNRHGTYQDYVDKQKEKTLDPVRIAKWQGVEWEIKLEGFRDLFRRNAAFVKNKTNAVCLGARTGQEVCALRESGIEAIGIDLVAFPPYTVEGDIHDLGFSEGEFDLVFTNSFDHALYPAKFVSEMERVCQTDGHIIVNLQIKMPVDDYCENSIHDPRSVSEMFVNSTVVEAREIHNTFDGMNYEFVFKKRE